MPKRKKRARRRSPASSSYSKQNIALGQVLGSVAPKIMPGWSGYLPLIGLLPRVPTSLKVASWSIATKYLSDKYIGGNS